jgi:hypothetical protein
MLSNLVIFVADAESATDLHTESVCETGGDSYTIG